MPDRRRAPNQQADLAAIDALVDRLVPALTAKLAATHLGELEVREGEWRIRLRRPPSAGGWHGEQRRAADRPGSARAGNDAHRAAAPGASNGTGPGALPYPAPAAGRGSHDDADRAVATSPAVGVFRPNVRATVGTRVREGDALGHVDVLGIREDVPSPVDGLVGELLVEAGAAVEYGQELIVIALPRPVA